MFRPCGSAGTRRFVTKWSLAFGATGDATLEVCNCLHNCEQPSAARLVNRRTDPEEEIRSLPLVALLLRRLGQTPGTTAVDHATFHHMCRRRAHRTVLNRSPSPSMGLVLLVRTVWTTHRAVRPTRRVPPTVRTPATLHQLVHRARIRGTTADVTLRRTRETTAVGRATCRRGRSKTRETTAVRVMRRPMCAVMTVLSPCRGMNAVGAGTPHLTPRSQS